MQYSRLRLLQEAFHDFNLLKVTGHVCGQHHLHHQGSKFSESTNGRRIQIASHLQQGGTGSVHKGWGGGSHLEGGLVWKGMGVRVGVEGFGFSGEVSGVTVEGLRLGLV